MCDVSDQLFLLVNTCRDSSDRFCVVCRPQGSLELQLYWVCELQNLLKSEHNQQIMCEAGLPLQLLQRCALAFADEQHPLHVPLQRIFERLASQALTPTVLR